MVNRRNRYPARRRFLKQTAALSAGVATLASPAVVLVPHKPQQAQDAPAASDGAAAGTGSAGGAQGSAKGRS